MKMQPPAIWIPILILLTLITIVGLSMMGIESIPWSVWTHPFQQLTQAEKIFWNLRVPRVLVTFLAGSGLALSGMVFQALFRNPLAEPFTLGISSGASLGATLAIRWGWVFSCYGISSISLSAFFGATLAIFLVYHLASLKRGFGMTHLLLAGIAVSFFFSSLILFIHYTSHVSHSIQIMHWLMGSVEVVGFDAVTHLLPFVLIGWGTIPFFVYELNLLVTGEIFAHTRGVAIQSTQRILFLITSLMVGGIVAVCGPISFIGMMAPHICRLLVGWDHRWLLPTSCLFGGIFLTVCDTFARVLIAPAEIPVGIITSLLGGPFFLWLLLSRSHGVWYK